MKMLRRLAEWLFRPIEERIGSRLASLERRTESNRKAQAKTALAMRSLRGRDVPSDELPEALRPWAATARLELSYSLRKELERHLEQLLEHRRGELLPACSETIVKETFDTLTQQLTERVAEICRQFNARMSEIEKRINEQEPSR